MGAKPGIDMLKNAIAICGLLIGFVVLAFPSNQPQDYLVTISVVSTPAEGEAVARKTYETGETVHVKITMTNTSTKTVNVPKGEDYSRPYLLRQGQPVAYRKQIAERIEKQELGGSSRVTGLLFLKPNEPQSDVIDLSYWYDDLRPGHYKLYVQRILFKRRVWSNTVFFEVLPCNDPKGSAPSN